MGNDRALNGGSSGAIIEDSGAAGPSMIESKGAVRHLKRARIVNAATGCIATVVSIVIERAVDDVNDGGIDIIDAATGAEIGAEAVTGIVGDIVAQGATSDYNRAAVIINAAAELS